eukprot:748465-Hanusia_phi.AAC.2
MKYIRERNQILFLHFLSLSSPSLPFPADCLLLPSLPQPCPPFPRLPSFLSCNLVTLLFFPLLSTSVFDPFVPPPSSCSSLSASSHSHPTFRPTTRSTRSDPHPSSALSPPPRLSSRPSANMAVSLAGICSRKTYLRCRSSLRAELSLGLLLL